MRSIRRSLNLRIRHGIVLPVGIFALQVAQLSHAQNAGRVDPTFGENLARTRSMALQSDGKILLGGDFPSAVVRLHPDGSRDLSFRAELPAGSLPFRIVAQPDGKVLLDTYYLGLVRLHPDGSRDFGFAQLAPDDGRGTILAVALQNDGNIIVAGEFSTYGGAARNRIVRLLGSNGQVDPSFNPGAGPNNFVGTLLIEPGGSILIGGWFTSVNGTPRGRLARLSSTGALDPDFNPNMNNTVRSLALSGGGKILAGGEFSTASGAPRPFLARVSQTNGALDPDFNPTLNGYVSGLATQADGRIICLGNFSVVNGIARSNIARLEAGGATDPSFDTGIGGPAWRSINDFDDPLLLLPNGVGIVFAPGGYPLRLGPNGAVDLTFKPDPALGPNGEVVDVSVQANGGVLFAGTFLGVNGSLRTGIGRMHADGSFDPEFNPGFSGFHLAVEAEGENALLGRVATTVSGVSRAGLARVDRFGVQDPNFQMAVNGSVNAIAKQPDGHILAAVDVTGGASNYLTPATLVRVNGVTGAENTGFTRATVTPTSSGGGLRGVGLDSAGRVLIWGGFSKVNNVSRQTVARLQSNGALDTSFQSPALTGAVNGLGTVYSAVAQPADRKVIIGGQFWSISDGTNDEVRNGIARLNENGTLDLSFNPGSGAGGALGGASSVEVVVLVGNKILIGGNFTTYNGTARPGLARLEANGALDPSFNPGPIIDQLGDNNALYDAPGTVRSISVESDGDILIGGDFNRVSDQPRNFLVRLKSDGSLDKTFNTGAGLPKVNAMMLQGEHRAVIVGGDFENAGGQPAHALARLRENGSHDPTFRPNYDPGDVVQAIARRPDGAFLVANVQAGSSGRAASRNGSRRSYSREEQPLATSKVSNPIRPCNADTGLFDDTFNGNQPDKAGANGDIHALAIQGAGQKILVAGNFTQLNTVGGFSNLGRLNADGTLDTTFTASANLAVRAMVVQPQDQKCVIAGEFTLVNGVSKNRIARIDETGALDGSFAVGSGTDGPVTAIALQNDGKVVLGGNFGFVQSVSRAGLARLHPNGNLDGSFQPGAITRAGAPPEVHSIVQQQDGKLIVAGLFDMVGNVPRRNIVRLNADGIVDTAYDPGAGPDDTVRAVTLQTDGKALLGGDFVTVDRLGRSAAARLFGDARSLNYRSSGAIPIPDNNSVGAMSSISVSGFTGKLHTAVVQLHITHTYTSDLTLALVGPDGTRVELSRRRGGSGDNYGTNCPVDTNDTVFDDGAPDSILWQSSSAPFVGKFRPEQLLSTFHGKTGTAVNGAWKLHVVDSAGADTGHIQCWSLTLTAEPEITGFSPPSGLPGTSVTISGSGLSAAAGVSFNGAPAVFGENSDTNIVAIVPPAASSGRISVSTLAATGTSSGSFVVLTDSDQDGMSDDFEQLYFGASSAGNPSGDADGDGMNNVDEFRSGTSPVDARSRFAVREIRREGNDVIISFVAAAHKRYRVEATTGVGDDAPIPIGTTSRTSSDTLLSVTHAGGAGSAQRFYRVLLLP